MPFSVPLVLPGPYDPPASSAHGDTAGRQPRYYLGERLGIMMAPAGVDTL